MKKLLIAAIMLMAVSVSDACPICGCGAGDLYMGLFPNFKSKQAGIGSMQNGSTAMACYPMVFWTEQLGLLFAFTRIDSEQF